MRETPQFWKPTLQTEFDEKGNCLSAVIATMFDVPIKDIPSFADSKECWAIELSSWLADFGKFVMPVRLAEEKDATLFNGSLLIAAINSENPRVERHAVITKNYRIVFDPMTGAVDVPITEDMETTFFVVGDIRTACNSDRERALN